ncbi:hypothetical protein, partial [Mycoplasmopsis bovis]|uniref:hypothetical protein n=1 Tax=Mycoplasmopsis bovis TaxID=28903 RepID=UPI003D2745FB
NLELVRDPGIKPKPDDENPPLVIKLNNSNNELVLPFFTQNTDKEKFKSQMIKIIHKRIEDNVKHNEWK